MDFVAATLQGERWQLLLAMLRRLQLEYIWMLLCIWLFCSFFASLCLEFSEGKGCEIWINTCDSLSLEVLTIGFSILSGLK